MKRRLPFPGLCTQLNPLLSPLIVAQLHKATGCHLSSSSEDQHICWPQVTGPCGPHDAQ